MEGRNSGRVPGLASWLSARALILMLGVGASSAQSAPALGQLPATVPADSGTRPRPAPCRLIPGQGTAVDRDELELSLAAGSSGRSVLSYVRLYGLTASSGAVNVFLIDRRGATPNEVVITVGNCFRYVGERSPATAREWGQHALTAWNESILTLGDLNFVPDSATAGDLALLFLSTVTGAAIALPLGDAWRPGVQVWSLGDRRKPSGPGVQVAVISSLSEDGSDWLIKGTLNPKYPSSFEVTLARVGAVRAFRFTPLRQ